MGMRKLATRAYHPVDNTETEVVHHTIALLLLMVANEHQNNWDEQWSNVKVAFKNSVSAPTELAPDEVHLGRLPRLPISVIKRYGASGNLNLGRDQLEYCDLQRERQ